MKVNYRILMALMNVFLFPGNALSDTPKSFRTFVTVKAFHHGGGDSSANSSDVRLEIKLPDGRSLSLPQKKQFWKLERDKSKEIEQTVEIPFDFIKSDALALEVSMISKGKDILPCQIQVNQLSQYNRSYVCRTDVNYQVAQNHVSEARAVREAVEIRVFTDVNSTKKEIPSQLLAFEKR